jgi:hypothetical protein
LEASVWVSAEKNAWPVAEELDRLRHFKLVDGRQLKVLTRRDPFERLAGGLLQYRRPKALVEKLARLKKKRRQK